MSKEIKRLIITVCLMIVLTVVFSFTTGMLLRPVENSLVESQLSATNSALPILMLYKYGIAVVELLCFIPLVASGIKTLMRIIKIEGEKE